MYQLNQPPTTNGYHAAPPTPGGAFAAGQERTSFPQEKLRPSLATFMYELSRGSVGGAPLLRWPQWFLFGGAVLWASGWLPGRWWVAGVLVALGLALQITVIHYRRRNFVSFSPATTPKTRPQALSPQAKIPIFATGHFTVEAKRQQFTWLPGFFRTFATREHALLCQVADRTLAGLGSWPASELGLWYVFFAPASILEIQWGVLTFGRNQRPALAVRYLGGDEPARKRQRKQSAATVFIAFQAEADGLRILADLLHDMPPHTRK